MDNFIILGIIKNNKNEILIVKRKNQEKGKDNAILSWAFPGGKLKEGETRENALKREVLEETGYQIKLIKQIHIWIHPEFQKILCYYLCELIDENPIQEPQESYEIEEIKWVKPEELKNYFTSTINPYVAKELNILP